MNSESTGLTDLVRSAALLAALCAAARPAAAAVYVVDAAHPSASDSHAGTEEAPFKTVQRAADAAQAGDTVYVMEGTYAETVTLKQSGRPGAKITFRGVPPHKAELRGLETGSAAHVRIEGFRFVDRGVTITSDHVEVVGNYFQDLRRQAVSGKAAAAHVALNRVYASSAGFAAGGSDWLVERNEVERMVCKEVESDYGRFFGRGHTFRRNFFHGTAQAEVAKSHVDGFQTWHRQGKQEERAHDMAFLDNMVCNFHQGLIARSTEPNYLGNFTIRGNVFAHGLLPNENGAAVGIILQNVQQATVEHNLLADIQWHAFSPRGSGGSTLLRRNIVWRANSWTSGATDIVLRQENNLSFGLKTAAPAEAAATRDPLFVDAAKDNWRLKPGSPAILDANGLCAGPLAWPNAYTVDPLHPGASDLGIGHPGRPFRTLARALLVAREGETVILCGGVYRHSATAADGVTIRAAPGEKVVLSGADLVEGWKRTDKGWAAPLAAAPGKLLRDGRPWTDFSHDASARTITVKTGGDPRLHVFEAVVREVGLDLADKRVRLEGVALEHFAGPALRNAARAALNGVTVDGLPAGN